MQQCSLCQTAVKEEWRLVGCRLSRSGIREEGEGKQESTVVPGIFFPLFSFLFQSVKPCRLYEFATSCMSSLSFFSLHWSLPHHLCLFFSLSCSLCSSSPTHALPLSLSLSLHTKAGGSQQRLNVASISQSTSCSNVSVVLSPLPLCRSLLVLRSV